jgi:hypothetical protein
MTTYSTNSHNESQDEIKKSCLEVDTYEKDAYNVIISNKSKNVVITEDDGYLD